MSPEQLQQFNDMQRRLHEIERATNVSFVAELSRRLAGSTITLKAGALSGTTVAVRNAIDTGSETVANDYVGAIVLTDQRGNEYTIGYY